MLVQACTFIDFIDFYTTVLTNYNLSVFVVKLLLRSSHMHYAP